MLVVVDEFLRLLVAYDQRVEFILVQREDVVVSLALTIIEILKLATSRIDSQIAQLLDDLVAAPLLGPLGAQGWALGWALGLTVVGCTAWCHGSHGTSMK